MNARSHRLGALVAGALGVLLGACGSGLHDASGVPLLEGGGQVCSEAAPAVCGGECTPEDASHCGASCDDCNAQPPGDVPPGAVAACVRANGVGTCGFECPDGLMRCASRCCEATALAAGERFTCARASDGSVSCWGANDGGQLGDGTTSMRAVPGTVPLSGSATAIGAGVTHACAVLEDGAVRCWGSDAAGQISGTPSVSPSLVAAPTPVTSGAVAIAAGASHTCALLLGGEVRCWGAPAQAAGGFSIAGATALAAGRDHTCAVVGGAVLCWGANGSGELGNASGADSASPVPAGALGGIQLLAARSGQTCAATGSSNGQPLDDAIQCWGDSLGDSLRDLVADDFGFLSPQRTPAIPLKDDGRSTIDNEVSLVAVGRKHVCVLNRAEAVECFGANDRGQLGGTPTGPTEAMTVPLPPPIAAPPAATPPIASAISAGADHTCAIVTGGRLRCWGANESGQLGNGSTADPGTGSIAAPLGR